MKLTITLAAAAALLAQGAAAAPPTAAAPKYDRNQCFYTRNVTGFAAPNDKQVYLRVGVRDVYRFDLMIPCMDIDWNQRIALVARPGPWVCNGMDAEIVSHATGLGPMRCPVTHMHKLTPDEIAALPPRAKP